MKSLVICLLIFFGSSVCFASETLSYQDAIAAAQKTNQKIFLYFGADRCVYCKKMETLLEDKDVANSLSEYIILKVDVDLELDLKKKYSVKAIPDYMLINKDEVVLKRHKGYKDKNSFLEWLKH